MKDDNKKVDLFAEQKLDNNEQESKSKGTKTAPSAKTLADYVNDSDNEKKSNNFSGNKVDKETENKIGKGLQNSVDLGDDNKGNLNNSKIPTNVPKNIPNNNSKLPNNKPNDTKNNKILNNVPGSSQIPNNNGMEPKPNYARNGIQKPDNIPNGNSDNANKNRLRNMFGRRNGEGGGLPFLNKKKSLLDKANDNLSNDEEIDTFNLAGKAIKKIVKAAIAPFLPLGFIFLLLFIILSSSSGSRTDVAAVDPNNVEKNGSTEYYSTSPEQKEFYDRVLKTKDDYKSNGKDINAMYITATYNILSHHKKNFKYRDMTQDIINELADAMLGGSTTYSKETYYNYLKDTFFKKHVESNDYKGMTEEVFEYIDSYLEDTHNDNTTTCSTTNSGSCAYDIKDYRGNSLNFDNLQVRLMSSSYCHGQDNVAAEKELVPFEDYVLGVARVENYSTYSESTKAQLIAARTFALNRPATMGPSLGNKYVKEGNTNILQMRSCVADQMFCSADKGCSADGPYFQNPNNYSECYVSYLGTNHPGAKIQPLSQTAPIRTYWKETMGMVAVDENNRLVHLAYTSKDQNAWNNMAKQGKDYVEILMTHYKQIKQIKNASCSTSTTTTKNSSFLTIAHELWKQVTDGNYVYTNGNKIPVDGRHIDCSTYVDWVLYQYGYSDFGGYQKVTQWFVTTDLHAKYGWTEIPVAAGEDVTSKLQPGDILVRDPGNNNGHMNIIAEIRSDGSVWGYDCGDTSNWTSSRGGKVYNVSSFVKGDAWGGGRPGKIIRVSNGGTGDSCQTAESGDWSTWRQNGDAPWKNIPLGNSGRTIGSHGCYVTSIAIQVARSGIKTNLANFNPGTLVTELNKSSNSFDSGGSLTGSGESNIKSIVPGFNKAVNYVELSNNKQEQINTIKKYTDQGYYVLLHLDNGRHWVAVTGLTNDNIQMVDPGRSQKNVYDVYPVSSCVGISVLDLK